MKCVKAFILALGGIIVLAFGAAAEEPGISMMKEFNAPEKLFYSGNAYYEKGEYQKAIDEYEKIIASGYESAGVYYNLGNAYFRAGRAGKALLNYERARRLAPADADINGNYEFVRSRIRDVGSGASGIWAWSPLKRYSDSFTVNGLLWISSGFYTAAVIFLLFAVYRRDKTRRFAAISGALILCLALNLLILWHEIKRINTEAVMTSPAAESHYGPSDTATVYFKLYEGMEVTVLKKKGGWCYIRRADGKSGWVRGETLEVV